MDQWERNYYITALAGANNGSSLVVMSRGIYPFFSYTFLIKFLDLVVNKIMLLLLAGTQYAQQSYKVSDSFPFKWINKKWREGFYVTAMATAGIRWAVVMSRNAGFTDQVI
jgi:hypothetical protein